MKLLSLFIVALTVALQSGCVIVTSYAKLEPKLKQWETEREYGRALDALNKVDPKDPDYAKAARKRMQVERSATQYEQKMRKEAGNLLKKGDWAAALDLYDEALDKYPKSAVIRDGLAKLHQQQSEALARLELKQLVRHGVWLREVLPVYRDIARTDPRNSDAQNRLARIETEAAGVAQELALIGNKALANNELNTADATLPLALKLSGDPVIEGSVNSLHKELEQLEKKRLESRRLSEQKARTAQKKKERTISAIKKRYQKAVAEKKYLSARYYLKELEEIDRRHPEVVGLKKSLRATIEKEVSRLFESGVNAYSRGQFEQAAKAWRTLLKLEPEHLQAKENLERAEKVLDNIQRLKEKQGN